ncbi:hypothetical protein M9H77_22351 [Catharanthus roseus]|uniref:Uncharacterized protein n=1 Tax=Catharanthus roseus TaxID=4058 RepID=A0ACC0APY5_CATRO|nr:hypothetical protein M9H77_22351 [Catharanthus roseus]
MLEVTSEQEDYQSKLTRDMHNFYHDGGNGVNAYGGNNLEIETSLLEDMLEMVTSLLMLNLMGHTYYDDYGGYDRDNAKYDYSEHSPYDCYKDGGVTASGTLRLDGAEQQRETTTAPRCR